MFDYLQKYQQVPAEVRAKLDSATTKAAIDNLEEAYHLSLASIIIKLVIKEIPLSRLALYLAENNNLDHDQANKLATEIQINILAVINDYLSKPLSAPIDINRLAKTNPVTLLPNTTTPTKILKKPLDLENILNKLVSQQQYIRQTGQLNRLRQAIKTFLIGVRNQKALEDYLTKSFDLGG
ncbi:MAG TPA: hypothetical protein PLT32_03395, partial [bacterium]|nr:hypothetical protein [bacterium]